MSHAARHMDRMYRLQRHIYDATRKFYLLGRDRLLADLRPADGETVLEIGCGTARNLVLAARRYPGARFYGVDISHEMLSTARRAIARAGLTDRITIGWADATDFDPARTFGITYFDRVFLSYTLSIIPPWQAALHQAAKHVAPGGSLHIIDFADCARLPAWFRQTLYRWLKAFSVEPRVGLERELHEVATQHGLSVNSASLFRGYARHNRAARPT